MACLQMILRKGAGRVKCSSGVVGNSRGAFQKALFSELGSLPKFQDKPLISKLRPLRYCISTKFI